MKHLVLLTAFIFNTFQEQPYVILVPGSSWVYKTRDGSFEDSIGEQKFTYKKIDYFQYIRKYSDGTADITYYRIEKDGSVYYLDNKSFTESIEVPGNPRLSLRWTSSDNTWHYKIVEVGAELKTPIHTFKDCIAIKAEPNSGDASVYINYYSKKIGFVGSKMDGELVSYLIKWTLMAKQS